MLWPLTFADPPPAPTAVELSELRGTWSADFSPLPADLAKPEGGGLKFALLNSTAVAAGAVRARKEQPAATREGIEFFEKKIRPVLTEKCYQCHSAGAEKV